MKKIIIVNDNLHLGGIQKSLVNLLKSIHHEYEITLLLLNKSGELLSEIPENVRVLSACSAVSVLGAYRKELRKNIFKYIWKGMLLLIARRTSKRVSFSISGIFQKKFREYDVAISYSHPSKPHDLRSCSAEFVLNKINASEKICFVHADYRDKSNRCDYTDLIYRKFDKIVCCSESVKQRFIEALPDLIEKTYTVKNFYDLSLVSDENVDFYYNNEYVNVVSVARLTAEKGIERAIKALHNSGRRDICYYIVGDGPERQSIESMIEQYALRDRVFLMGESKTPKIFMKNADYLLVPSYHEAAPMVFDEAKLLGVKIVTTNTTSAVEMVENDIGIVCENSMKGIEQTLLKLKKEALREKKIYNNETQQKQFYEMIHSVHS